MFSDLPNLFDRKFATGFLLPAILFAFGSLMLASYSFGLRWLQIDLRAAAWGSAQIVIVKEIDSATFLLGLFALVSFVVAILLMVLNRTLIRFLEGYYPPLTWFKDRAVRQFKNLQEQKKEVVARYNAEKKQFGKPTPETSAEYSQVLLLLAHNYPPEERLILPTALGNVIRAAEAYSYKVYGADIILLWPRLLPAMEADFRGFLEDAKSSLDFSINLFYVAGLLLLEALLFFSLSTQSTRLWSVNGLLVLLLLGFTAFIAYRVAIARAYSWGQYLRAASDLYLNKMLEKLGLEAPEEAQSRIAYFKQLSQAVTFMTALPTSKKASPSKQNVTEKNPLPVLALATLVLGAAAIFLQAVERLMASRWLNRR